MNVFAIPDILYYVVMALAGAGWLALIFFPHRPWANFWFSGLIVPLLLCVLYMYLLLTFWFLEPPARFSDFFSLKGVYSMFGNSGLLLVGWTNLIAMDLVAGAWMTRKAVHARIPHVYIVPCLVMTFVFAGFGFAMFAMVSAVGGRWRHIAEIESIPSGDSLPLPVKL
jgi:hypothetical protein